MPHSDFFPDCFHRVTVKGLCIRDGRVLFAKEGESLGGAWELPGGGLDFGENIKDAFRREIQEEMGLKVTKMSEKPVYIWTHKFEPNHRNINWYYSLVLAYRIELESLDFTPTEECREIAFYSKEEMKGIDLCQQSNEFLDIFDPEDFKEAF